ncbi:MarR family transcriptional regulator [Streptococcus mutans]|nr:MarR family transcriptional regulator [Streptococcus mutans]
MGVSKPSVSYAVKLLREGGFIVIVMTDDYTLHLT